MRKKYEYIVLALATALITGCKQAETHNHDHEHEHMHAVEHEHEDEEAHEHEHDHEHEGAHSHEHEREGHKEHGDAIILTPEKAQAAGVELATVQKGTFNEVIPISGRILPAAGDETTVSATVSGIVHILRPLTEGASIGNGTSLFSISSKGLQEGDAVQRARIEYEAALKTYERDAELVKDKIVSERHFQESLTALENAKLAYEALGTGRGEGTSVAVRTGGFVKEVMVKEGDFVSMGQPLATLTRNKDLYLRAEVPERYYGIINNVQSAKFKTPYSDQIFDLKELNGSIVSQGKTVETSSYYIPVTFKMDNSKGLTAGTLAEIWLIGRERQDVLSLPTSALTEEQGLYFVYLLDDDDEGHDSYHKREVSVGTTNGTHVEIVSGLHGGEQVVVKGAMHVKLAAASTAIPGHTHNH